MNNVFKSYDALYNSILATTVITNTFNEEAVSDCKKIINFVCEAYGKDEEFTSKIKKIVLEDLVCLGVMEDLNAFDAGKSFYKEYADLDKCLEIKYEIIRMLTDLRTSHPGTNFGFVNFDHYNVYQPCARYKKLLVSAMRGDLVSTRELGILQALGIGCEKNFEDAKRRFLQCTLWGDVQSAYLLAYLLRLMNDKKSIVISEVAELMSSYLDDGITVLPKDVKEKYSEEANAYFIYISSIKYDVVYAYDLSFMDFSFLEVIMSDDADYNKKMTFIDQYRDKKWKSFTNKVTENTKRTKIGF